MDFDDTDNFALGPSDGIGSQDFLDIGITFGDADETMSVEVGRRDSAPIRGPRESLGSHLLGRGSDDFEMLSNMSRDPSENPFAADVDMDLGIPDVDLGFGLDAGEPEIDLQLTFGEPMNSDHEKTPGTTTRACK